METGQMDAIGNLLDRVEITGAEIASGQFGHPACFPCQRTVGEVSTRSSAPASLSMDILLSLCVSQRDPRN